MLTHIIIDFNVIDYGEILLLFFIVFGQIYEYLEEVDVRHLRKEKKQDKEWSFGLGNK